MPVTEPKMNPDTLNAISAQVKRIAQTEAPPRQRLGFGPGPKLIRHVYCNLKHGGSWYFMDENRNPIVIEHEALTGYVREIEFTPAINQDQMVFNLNCTLESNALYVLVSESTAQFSKGLLSAIAQLTPSELQQPLTIVPQVSAGDEEVLTCEVYRGDRLVSAPYDETTDWKRVSQAAVNAVKLTNDGRLSHALPV
jgi:hypothetical protein